MAETRVPCPQCGTALRTAADPSASRLRCPSCQHVFRPDPPSEQRPAPRQTMQATRPAPAANRPQPEPPAPPRGSVQKTRGEPPTASRRPVRANDAEEEADDDPDTSERPTRGRGNRQLAPPSRKGLMVGLAVGGGLLLVGLGIFLIAKSGGKKDDPGGEVAQNPPPGPVVPPNLDPNPQPPPNPNPNPNPPNPNQPREGLDRVVLERVKKATVYIRVRDRAGRTSTGTGFFSLSNGLVMTNAHVVGMLEPDAPPPASVEVVLDSGLRGELAVRADVLTVDRPSDLAVLRTTPPRPDTVWPPPLPIVEANNLVETQKLYVVGYPFGEELGKNVTVSESSVSSLRRGRDGHLDRVQVNGGMHPGNSGGPVINDRGEVVGVAVSGIRNTQINFAVPGEYVHAILRGRVSGSGIGEATLTGGVLTIPFKVDTIDPLQTIRSLSVDWWYGNPGEARAPSEVQPRLLPTDGPRTTTPCRYDAPRCLASADLPLAQMPSPGKVLWHQVCYTDGDGKQRWVAAMPHSLKAPLEAGNVRLANAPTPSRTLLDVRSTAKLTLKSTAGDNHSLMQNMVAQFREDVRSTDRAGNAWTYYSVNDKFEIGLSLDDKGPPPSAKLKKIINDVNFLGMFVQTDAQGGLAKRAVDLRRAPASSREVLEALGEQLHESLALGLVPLPNRDVQPGENWHAKRALGLLPVGEDSGASTLPLTYTYRGIRREGAARLAVIELSGELEGFEERRTGLRGRARGEALYDVAQRRVVQVLLRAEVTLTMRFEDEDLKAQGTLEVELKRGTAGPLPPPNALPSLAGLQLK